MLHLIRFWDIFSITINSMTVREEADIYRVVNEIYRNIKSANVNYAESI